MPYLCAVFDEATQAVIAEAAARFAASSAFTFDKDHKFHIPVIGSLHVYNRDEIATAIEGFKTDSTPLQGHFVRWEASPSARLRAVVALAPHEGLVRSSQLLPQGREWRDELFVDIGSLAAINRADWVAFVDAVEAAFPITSSSEFVCSHLDYVDRHDARGAKKQSGTKGLNPNARPFRPSAQKKARRKVAKPKPGDSPHKKWVRQPKKAVTDSMDLAGTGPTGSRAIAKKQKPGRRVPPPVATGLSDLMASSLKCM